MNAELVHVRLEPVRGNTSLTRTAWLPPRLAVVGGVVRLRADGGDWGDGWRIAAVDDANRPGERSSDGAIGGTPGSSSLIAT
jgi:hypothetical protein